MIFFSFTNRQLWPHQIFGTYAWGPESVGGLSDWSHNCRPFPGFNICSSVCLCFSSIFLCFSFSALAADSAGQLSGQILGARKDTDW